MERPESSGTMLATGSFGVTANGTIGAGFSGALIGTHFVVLTRHRYPVS